LCGEDVVDVEEGAAVVDVPGTASCAVLRLEVVVDPGRSAVVVVVAAPTSTSGGSASLAGDLPRAVIVVPPGPFDEREAAAIDDAARTSATIHARARGDGT
jgi:hypothetical protein